MGHVCQEQPRIYQGLLPVSYVLVGVPWNLQLEQKSYLGRTSGMLEERKADAQVTPVMDHPPR